MLEVFPSAVVRRGGPIVELQVQIRPEIGGLKLIKPGEPNQTLDQFVNNGAVDGCIVLHGARLASAVVSGSFASELLSYPDLFREDHDHGHGS